MEYHEPKKYTQQEASKIFSKGSDDEICSALLGVVLAEEDWKWCQDQYLYYLHYPEIHIRRTAALCLGHLARIHRKLETEKVVNALKQVLNDKDRELVGIAEDALDDIAMFM